MAFNRAHRANESVRTRHGSPPRTRSVLAVVPVASGDISGGSSSSEEIESEFSLKSESSVRPEIGVFSVVVSVMLVNGSV